MVEVIEFKDKKVAASCGRKSYVPELFFQKGEEFYRFTGENIPGVCRVLTSAYVKNGVWSYTTWAIRVGEGVTPWEVRGGEILERGKKGYGENPARTLYVHTTPLWEKLPVELHPVVRACLPQEAARLDENDLPVLRVEGKTEVWKMNFGVVFGRDGLSWGTDRGEAFFTLYAPCTKDLSGLRDLCSHYGDCYPVGLYSTEAEAREVACKGLLFSPLPTLVKARLLSWQLGGFVADEIPPF